MLPTVVAAIGAPEILLGVAVVVLLFGAAKIPELARSLGKAKGEYRKAAAEGEREEASRAGDEADTLRAARALGIPTEGRPLADVKADIRRKMGA